QRYSPIRGNRQFREQPDKLLYLRPVDFVTGKHVGGRGDADHLRLQVARALEQPFVKLGWLDDPTLCRGCENRVLPCQRSEVQAALDRVLECNPVMVEDCG